MLCSKIGSECPHPVDRDEQLIFVMMPFAKVYRNVYYAISKAVKGIEGKNFECVRADKKYTTFAIWCQNICKNIRKSKYLIVDTSGKNPNVFYELGFSHALQHTKAILITQGVKDAPFDIKDLYHIEYSREDLDQLEDDLKKAIVEMVKTETEEGYKSKTSDEMIIQLKIQLREEEERAAIFKKELLDSEERERKLKERLREVEAIKDNPAEEAKNQITILEGKNAELKSKLKKTEESNREEVNRLNHTINENEKKLKNLEKELDGYKKSKDDKLLSTLLLDDTKRKADAETWFIKGYNEYENGNYGKAIEYYTKSIDLKTDDASAYNNRGFSYTCLKEYKKAINDYKKAIELKPDFTNAHNNIGVSYNGLKKYETAIDYFNKAIELNPDVSDFYNNRGDVYRNLEEYKKAAKDYNKALELKPYYALSHEKLAELFIISGNYKLAQSAIEEALLLPLATNDKAICLYLECIVKKTLDLDTMGSEKKYNEILKENFETGWSFEPIESWLAKADINEEKKKFIIEKTELLKKRELGQGRLNV